METSGRREQFVLISDSNLVAMATKFTVHRTPTVYHFSCEASSVVTNEIEG